MIHSHLMAFLELYANGRKSMHMTTVVKTGMQSKDSIVASQFSFLRESQETKLFYS